MAFPKSAYGQTDEYTNRGRDKDAYGNTSYILVSGATYSFGRGTIGISFVSGASSGSAAGLLTSMGGGTIIGGTAVDSAFIAAANSGMVLGAYASSGASVDAMNGGIVSNAIVGSSGALAAGVLVSDGDPLRGIGQGGTALNPHILSGGYSLTGGAPNLVVKGYEVQGSGGLISGGTFDSGSEAMIGFGGTAINGIYRGLQWVQSGGRGSGGLFTGPGATQIINGGIASNGTAINNGLINVSGAYGVGLTAMQGGTVAVQGGTYQGMLDNGIGGSPSIGDYTKGYARGNTVNNGGTEIIGSDGAATSSHIYAGGQGTILNGGVAIGVDVNGGTETVSSGGYVTYGSAANSGLIDVQAGGSGSSLLANVRGTVLADGGVVTGLTVNGGTGDVLNGGSVTNYTITASGGIANVHNGQVNNFTINGGTGQAYSGATINNLLVGNGTGFVNSGAQAGTFTISGSQLSGSGFVMPGGSVQTLAVAGNGTAVLSNGGSAGTVTATGRAGTAIISGYAGITHATNSGAISAVSGSEIGNFNIETGGTGYIYSGAKLDNTPGVTGAGGTLLLESGVNTNAYAQNQGTLVADSGSVSQTLTAVNGGTVVANSGATGQNILASGGSALLSNGASFTSMTMVSNGTGILNGGATVNSMHVAPGGSGILLPGASASTITVDSGGWISGATIANGNTMTVASGGTATNTLVTYQGSGENTPNVFSGGTAVDTTIAGASKEAEPGGLLTIESGANLSNTSMGYNARLRILGLSYDGNGTTYMKGNTLYVVESGATWSTTLNGSYHGNNGSDGFILLDDGQGNTVIVYDQCFLAGTLIRLEQGEVPVETIKPGDRLRSFVNGQEELRDVTNVLKKRASVHTDLPNDMAGWSVIIDKDAFADGVPSQALSVTPEHCFYFDGRFVPARMLVNQQTIRYDYTQTEYDFYHIETQSHSIIWANNTLTESYLNTTEQRRFENDDDNIMRLLPQKRLTWEKDAAAPLEVSQAFVEPLFKRFQQRAVLAGLPELTRRSESNVSDDPDLRILLEDGTIIRPTRRINNRVLFFFPAQTHAVRLVSRRFRPSESIGPFVDDRRTLGVLVGDITLWTGGHDDKLTDHLTDDTLSGWDMREVGPHRWTHGDATIPLPQRHHEIKSTQLLAVEIQAGGPYILSTEETMQQISAS